MSRNNLVSVTALNFGRGSFGVGLAIEMAKGEKHLVATVTAWKDGSVRCNFCQLPQDIIALEDPKDARSALEAYHQAINLAFKQYWDYKSIGK